MKIKKYLYEKEKVKFLTNYLKKNILKQMSRMTFIEISSIKFAKIGYHFLFKTIL